MGNSFPSRQEYFQVHIIYCFEISKYNPALIKLYNKKTLINGKQLLLYELSSLAGSLFGS